MNTLLTQIQFGIKKFKNFRKRLVLDYKMGGKHDHTNPHAIPLKLKQKLINVHSTRISPKKAEIGKQSGSSKDRASLLSEGSPNMVLLPTSRLYLPER